jgi:hypothetical protein
MHREMQIVIAIYRRNETASDLLQTDQLYIE